MGSTAEYDPRSASRFQTGTGHRFVSNIIVIASRQRSRENVAMGSASLATHTLAGVEIRLTADSQFSDGRRLPALFPIAPPLAGAVAVRRCGRSWAALH